MKSEKKTGRRGVDRAMSWKKLADTLTGSEDSNPNKAKSPARSPKGLDKGSQADPNAWTKHLKSKYGKSFENYE